MYKKSTISYFDFFSGIGGFRLAANTINSSKVAFKHNGYCEIDNTARMMYEESINKTSNLFFVDNINKIITKKNKIGIKLDEFDLMLAGFPCQSFSNVGYRRGLEDSRGKLFYNILDILDFYSPKYFILENVQKISTIKLGKLLIEMRKSLENIGKSYHLHIWDLNSRDYGLPQNRRRVFFCGIRSDLSSKKTINEPPKKKLSNSKYPTTWHLLEKKIFQQHIIPKKTRKTVLYKNEKWMGNVHIDNYIARPITATMGKWHRANQDNYFSETYLNEKNINPLERPKIKLEKEKIRRISPLEGFRLQGFPDVFDDYRKKLSISNTAVYRLIGNAVPIDLARAVISHFLKSYL